MLVINRLGPMNECARAAQAWPRHEPPNGRPAGDCLNNHTGQVWPYFHIYTHTRSLALFPAGAVLSLAAGAAAATAYTAACGGGMFV